MKIAALHMSPRSTGGAETAFDYTVRGIRQHVEVNVLALSRKDGNDWSEHARSFVDEVIHPTKEDLDAAIAPYDGVVLSDINGENGKLLNHVLDKSKSWPKWAVGRHWTSTSKTAMDRHERMMKNPAWSRVYVTFWEQVENLPEGDFGYERAVLPYVQNETLRGLPPISQRPIDFGFVGRTESKKGPMAFVAALEALTRQSDERFTAVIAGRPVEARGGPHIASVADRLEEWGWHVTREGESMKSKWTAQHPVTGSVIWHTAGYDNTADLPRILGSIKCYLNVTSGKYAPGHLEYSTMEALDAGCMVIAPNDWSSWHYADRPAPVVSPIPQEAYVIQRSPRRVVYLDSNVDAPDTTYKSFGEQLGRAKVAMADPGIDDRMESLTKHNRKALALGHAPRRSALAHLKALGLGSVWSD